MVDKEIILRQVRVFKSITNLPETRLPPFTLLTGINGSGKSHLLEAIREGAVRIEEIDNPSIEVQLYDWKNLVPNDAGIINISQVYQHRDWFIHQLRDHKVRHEAHLSQILSRFGLDKIFASDPWAAVSLTQENAAELGISNSSLSSVLAAMKPIENNVLASMKGNLGGDKIKMRMLDDLIDEGFNILRVKSSHFEGRPFSAYSPGLFQHSFGEMFFAYFDKLRANRSRRLDEQEGRTPSVPALSEDEFIAKNGRPPWDFVNEMFVRAKLDFQIDHPVEYESTEYLPRLSKISNGSNIQFSSLSSGEKVLMSFAFCLYQSSDRRQVVGRPKLILLDEVDAPLHPSMSRVLVEIISSVLVENEGIPVIMVTHSPSTVAVAPDYSIHTLEPSTNRILKESKRQAVSALTAEIPTMSIDFSGRRQIFVESDYDAERYSLLYQILAPFLESERSLAFIGIGHSNMGTGSSQVIATVESLASAGNVSVFGLIDWDTKNRSNDRVVVLGEGERYAIENCLLDPLLVAAAVLNEQPEEASNFGLSDTETFAAFSNLAVDKLQKASFSVQEKIATHLALPGHADHVECKYLGGISVNTDRRYLFVQGHDLEQAIKDSYPCLRRYHNTGELMRRMINVVIRNHPLLVPRPVVDSFKKLCVLDSLS